MSELFEKISKMSRKDERMYLELELAKDPKFLMQMSKGERLKTVHFQLDEFNFFKKKTDVEKNLQHYVRSC